MQDTGSRTSRRQVLRYCGVGATVSLAGCLWGGDGDDSPDDGSLSEQFELAGNGADPFREWLLPDNPIVLSDGARILFQYNDYEAAAEQGWEDMEQQRQTQASSFGSDVDSHDGELFIGPPESGEQTGNIQIGSFDRVSIVEFLEESGQSVTDEYRDYSIISGEVAVGDDALVVTPMYEQYIDAKMGEKTRMGAADEGAGIILDLVPSGVQISVSRSDELEDVDVSGSSVQEVDTDGTFQRMIRTFVFKSESDASVDRAREIVSEGGFDEMVTSEQHGRVVMVEYVP